MSVLLDTRTDVSYIAKKKIDPIPTKPTLVNQIAKLKQTNKNLSIPLHIMFYTMLCL